MLRLAEAAREPGRLVPADQLHMTLLFLGDIDRRQLDETVTSVERSAAGITAFGLQPSRLVTLPQGGPTPPRLIALETDCPPALAELQQRLARRLARPGQRRRERFLPHFTLKRFDHGVAAGPIDQAVDLEPLPITAVRLMSSVLGHGGARHDPIAEFPLAQ